MTVSTLGGDFTNGRSRPATWLPPLVPIAIATFALSALVSYHLRADGAPETRSILQWAIIGIYQFVGFAPSFLFFLLVLSWSSIWFVTGKLERPGVKLVRLFGFTLAIAIWVNLDADPSDVLPHSGALGAWIGSRMVSVLGTFLGTLLVAPLTLVSLLLATDFFFIRYFEGMRRPTDSEPVETGVEPDVTEHFKSLARTQPGKGAIASLPALSTAPLDDLVALADLQSAVATFGDAETAAGHASLAAAAADREEHVAEAEAEVQAEEPPRRLSYFERRQLAAERAALEAAAAEPTVESTVESEVEPSAEPHAASQPDQDAVAAAEPAVERGFGGDAEPTSVNDVLADEEEDDEEAVEIAVEAEPPRGWLAPVAAGGEEGDAAAEDDDEDDRGDELDAEEAEDDELEEGESAVGETVVAESAPIEPASRPAETSSTALFAADAATASDEAEDGDEAEEGDEAEDVAAGDESEDGDGAELPTEAIEAAPAVAAAEPVVAIPRPPEGVRQQRLFLNGLDDNLVREATDIVLSARRVSAAMLQRKLRIEFDQAVEVLGLLAHRGVIELGDDGTQGRVL